MSLREIRSLLPAHDKYLEPFPEDVEATFADLLDALDSEQQHSKVGALGALFRRGLSKASSSLGQVDFGHRVLLFLVKTRGNVVDSRVDEVFMRAFMRAVGSKKRKEAELEQENERVRTMLAEEDAVSEDGRWWRQTVSFSSGDDLSDWSDSDIDVDDDSYIDSNLSDAEDPVRASPGTVAEGSVKSPGADGLFRSAESRGGRANRYQSPRCQQQRVPLPLLRDRSAHFGNGDVNWGATYDRGNPYSDPRSLAVWMAVKSNPAATHLSECLNPRRCLSNESFVEQMLNAIMGFERPGAIIGGERTYELVEGVHMEGVSVSATRSVAGEVLEVANALRTTERGLPGLSRVLGGAVGREIRACRQLCLEERPRSLVDLVRASCMVRHRVMLLDAVVRSYADDQSSATDVIQASVDRLELVCSSGAMATSMGMLLELFVASDGVNDALRPDVRRICREYMAATVVGGDTSSGASTKSVKLATLGSPRMIPSPISFRKMEWWEEEYNEMAGDVPMTEFTAPSPSPRIGAHGKGSEASKLHAAPAPHAPDAPDAPDAPFFLVNPDALHYQMMEGSSRNALDRYWRGTPFAEYDSLRAVRASVLQKIDDMFVTAATVRPTAPNTPTPPAGMAARPTLGDVQESISPLQLHTAIYPLPPTFQFETMSKASAPRLDASQLARLGDQIAVIKRVCLMRLPFDAIDDDLRDHVESMWTDAEDGGQRQHHIAFRAPLSGMLGPDARRGVSAARGAAVSLQEAWKMVVDGRRESLQGMRSPGARSSSRAEHLRGLATIAGIREASRAIELAFWHFEQNVSPVMYIGSDVAHVTEVINCQLTQLGQTVKVFDFTRIKQGL